MKILSKILLLVYLFSSISAHGIATFDFTKVWRQYREKSLILHSQEADLESIKTGLDRSERHWYPRLLLDSKGFVTNDPGSVLFSKLGERSVAGEDFNPLIMNFPDRSMHEKVSLILDMTLYEGGRSERQVEYLQVASQAKQLYLKATEVAEFSKVVGYYGGLIVLDKKEKALLPLRELVEGTLKRYQIGQQSNLLGYSGLLGLKNLKNRIHGELQMLEAQKKSIWQSLQSYADLPLEWNPTEKTLFEFFKKNVIFGDEKQRKPSFAFQSQQTMSEASEILAQAEKSRFLPKVGVFADQTFFNNHETNFANSQTVGVYMQWALFDATNFGAYQQAHLKAVSEKKTAEAMAVQYKNEFEVIGQSIQALEQQILLADESLKYLEEQSEVSRRLFNNGLINALQLTEVYGRRIEVIIARSMMEDNILKAKAQMINYVQFEIGKE